MALTATQNQGLNWLISGAIFLAVLLVVQHAYGIAPAFVKVRNVQSKEIYKVDVLRYYRFVYVDRGIVFTSIPDCLEGNSYVVTANSDKFSGGSDFLTLYSDRKKINVYVGYDSRYGDIPDWLQKNFVRIEGLQLTAGNPKIKMAQIVYDLYRSEWDEANIRLGGNWSGREKSSFSMYTAIFVYPPNDSC